ncbi:MAG: hypothetical protein Kow0069_00090 [Promethearchaeota archaeon]
MRVFYAADGSIVQLVDEEKIKHWEPETPVLFVNYVRDNLLSKYTDKKLREEVQQYLDHVLETIALPKLGNALSSPDPEVRLAVARRLEGMSRSSADSLKPLLPFLKGAADDPNKEVRSLVKKIEANYQRAQKRKEYNKRRQKMRELDRKLAAGKISDAEYLKERKTFLKLAEEVGDEE